jgi:triacylglycerol esterase/lipase EstA (alpha/beta hydrolase family)
MKKLVVMFFVTILITYNSFCQPIPLTASIPYNGIKASGTYMVYRAWNLYNIPLTNLRKPLILVEGFDPNGDYGIADIYSMIQDNNFANRVHNLGYDIIILNFGNGGDYIQRNAFLLVELINQINAQKPTNEPLVVAGFSMGGLVARYALTYMEQHSMNHQTKLYVSLDSPNKGAHIPAGIQALALSFDFDLYKSMFPDLQKSLNMFQAPAAKQMLKYRLTNPDQIDGEIPISSDFTNFFNELNNLNSCSGFPQNCRNIAISLGNWNGRPQRSNIDSDGDGYKDFQQSGMPMIDINLPKGSGGTQSIWNASTCDIIAAFTFQARVGTMYSDNYPGFSTRSSSFWNLGNYYCTTYWYANPNGSPLFPLGAYQHTWQYKNKEALDFAPGSFVPIGSDIVNSMNSQINCSFAYVSNSTFIPTVSSLCYDTDNLFYDIGNDPSKLNKTPFDSIYGLSGENTSHITGLTTNIGLVDWLIRQISTNYAKTKGCCPYFPSLQLAINGPSIVCSSGSFTVNYVPTGCTVYWYKSSNITLPADRTTNPIEATANGNGPGWILAIVSSSCGSDTLPQLQVSVRMGAPSTPGNIGFRRAGGTCYYQAFISPVPGADSYDWSEDNVNWENLETSYGLFDPNSTVSVYVRARNGCGVSATKSKTKTMGPTPPNCMMKPIQNSTDSTQSVSAISDNIIIYPNPAESEVTVCVTSASSDTYEEVNINSIAIIDSYGNTRKIKQYGTGLKSVTINICDLPKGFYYIRVNNNAAGKSHKFLIQK